VSSHLSREDIQQLAPLLGSLARLVARGSHLSENELRTLLLGSGVEYNPAMMKEIKIWCQLLQALYEDPTSALRQVTVEALLLRDLPEASILLAVDTVTSSAVTGASTAPQFASSPSALKAQPPTLDFGTLAPGQPARGTLDIQGGPGHVVVDSDQVRVVPAQFGVGTTRLQIEARPISGGFLWTSVRLVTSGETLEVPLLAQWTEVPQVFPDTPVVPAYQPPPVAPASQRGQAPQGVDLATMIQQTLGTSVAAGGNQGGQSNAAPAHQSGPVPQSGDLASMIQQALDASARASGTQAGQKKPAAKPQQKGGSNDDILRQLDQFFQ
jgi:hypothetical protein